MRKKLPMVLKTNHDKTQSLMGLLGCDDVTE